MSLKTNITRVTQVNIGEGVGYDYTFRAERVSRIATLPIGYADGLPRCLSNQGYVSVQGKPAKIVGLMCMDQCMIDITQIDPLPEIEDEVVLLGRQKDMEIGAKHLAKLMGPTANDLEVVCGLSKRLPRVYIWHGRPVAIYDMTGLHPLD